MKHLLRFGVVALATWRVTHLLANEDGPGDAIGRIREKLGKSQLVRLMDCFHCTSIWVAARSQSMRRRNPPIDWRCGSRSPQ